MVGLLVCAIWAAMAWLFHEGYPWARPLFYGLVAACMSLITYFGFVLTKRLPKPRIVPTLNNIEHCVRIWLDNHKVTVKNDPYPDHYFRYRITLDSGCYLTILRSKSEFQDYVQIWCDLGIRSDEDKHAYSTHFTDRDKMQMLMDVKTELARAKVGYSGLVDPPEDFKLFQRVPIYPALTEFTFINMIGNIEAARNLVFLMMAKPLMKSGSVALVSSSDMSKVKTSA